MKQPFIYLFALALIVGCGSDAPTSNSNNGGPPPPPVTKWTLNPSNPVLAPAAGAWDGALVGDPAVVMFRDTLRMLYVGSAAPAYGDSVHIGYAWSTNGTAWHRSATPVLPAQAWAAPHLIAPTVLVDGDTLRMWFGGGNAVGTGLRIGYATSVDGVNWNRHGTPVISHNQAWNADGVVPGGVVKEGGVFKMWFSGGVGALVNPPATGKWSVGLATSSDGINWTLPTNPVLEAGGTFDQNLALSGTVRKTSTGYEMWYTGSRKSGSSSVASIGYATSPDGVTWKKLGSVLSSPGASGIFGDAYYSPHVLVDGSTYRMWFAAWHPGPTIGYATGSN